MHKTVFISYSERLETILLGHKYCEIASLRKVSIELTLDWKLMKSNEKTKHVDWIAPSSYQNAIKKGEERSSRNTLFATFKYITLQSNF